MNGIAAPFTGRIGKGCEMRTARDGKPWASFPVAVDARADGEAPTTWVRVALFGDAVAALAPGLLNAWTGKGRPGACTAEIEAIPLSAHQARNSLAART